MKKTGSTLVIVLVVAGLLVAGGVAAYVATDGFNSQDEGQEAATQQESPAETESEAESSDAESATALIKSALEGGDAVKCSFEQNGYPGSAYITSNNNFRVDGQSDEGRAHMIKSGDSAYIWVDGQSEGYEFSGEAFNDDFDERFDTFNPEEFEENAETSNVNDIDCQRADVDQSRFELPDNVNFLSWEDVMQGAQPQQ